MLLALAMILMQAPAVQAPAMPNSSTNSAVVSSATATDAKSETKPAETKSADVKDGEKKSADNSKETVAPGSFASTIFPSGSNVRVVPGQTLGTPAEGMITVDPETFSSSLSPAAAEPVRLAPIKMKRPEAAGIGVPKMWFVLGAMEHGAATFDAWSTRRNMSNGTFHESNPMLRPFANSGAMYAAVQVAPVLFDLLSKQMLRNSHSWVRKSWWVPQTASTVTSILSGAHNMAIH